MRKIAPTNILQSLRTPSTDDRLPSVVLGVVMLACFGPYVIGGLRTEQLVVYPLGLAAGLSLSLRSVDEVRRLLSLACVWAVYAIVATASAFIPPSAAGEWTSSSLLSGLDNVWLPLAALSIGTWLATSSRDVARTLRLALSWLIGLMLVNTVAVGLQILGVSWRAWWSAMSVRVSVAENAEGNWRYSGLLNQPVESGFLYSLAIVAAILVIQRHWLLSVCLGVLTLGAVSSVSKIFLLFGLPFAILLLVRRSARPWRAVGLIGAAVVVMTIVAMTGLFDSWSGAYQIRQIIPQSGGDWISSLSASRFGSGSTLLPVAEAVWATSPLIGIGAAGLAVSYDNGWIEAFIMAGLVGVACYTGVLGLGFWRFRRLDPGLHRVVLGSVVLLSALASTGFPTLTGNRCATVVWMLLGLTWLGDPNAIRHPTVHGHRPQAKQSRQAPPAGERTGRSTPPTPAPRRSGQWREEQLPKYCVRQPVSGRHAHDASA
jgi:hypothetical protein